MTCDWPTRHYRFGNLDSHLVTPAGIHPHRANQTGAESDWYRGGTCKPGTWCGCKSSAFYRPGRAWRCMRCGLRAEHRIEERRGAGVCIAPAPSITKGSSQADWFTCEPFEQLDMWGPAAGA